MFWDLGSFKLLHRCKRFFLWNYEVPSSISRSSEQGCGAFWRHGFAKRKVTLSRFHRISDFVAIGTIDWKNLDMCLDIFPTWLQTQRWGAPKSIPSKLRGLNPWSPACSFFLHYLVLIWTNHCEAIGPPPKKNIKNDNKHFRTNDQQLILTEA